MIFSYSFATRVPHEFLLWLKEHGFDRINRREFVWKKTKNIRSSADYEIVRLTSSETGDGKLSYRVVLEYWGTASSNEVYAYDIVTYDTFELFLKGNEGEAGAVVSPRR